MSTDVTKAVEVLIVEDNPRDAELCVRAFKRRNLANSLHVVEDGAEALDFLFARNAYEARRGMSLPRVILLDLKLPKKNGLEVLREIKADESLRSIPVVVVTSSAQHPDIKTAYELGANSYVVKPVSFEDFVKSMSSLGFYWLLINEPRPSTSDPLP